MFYDERIENERGRISRNALIFAVVVSLVAWVVHTYSMWGLDEIKILLWISVMEPAVVLVGGIILAIGGFIGMVNRKDERVVFLQNHFFARALPVALLIIFGVYALFLPINVIIGFPINTNVMGFDYTLKETLLILSLYFIYEFKKSSIYFNYSVIDDRHYYKRVFQRIGKFALIVLAYFAVSFLITFFFVLAFRVQGTEVIVYLFKIILKYLLSFLFTSLVYLLWSYLEKESYIREKGTPLSSLVFFAVAVGINALYPVISLIIESLDMTQVESLMAIHKISFIPECVGFCLFVFYMYFYYEYRKQSNNPLIERAVSLLWIMRAFNFGINQVQSNFSYVYMIKLKDVEEIMMLSRIVSWITTVCSCLSNLLMAVIFGMTVVALIKDKKIRSFNNIAVILFGVYKIVIVAVRLTGRVVIPSGFASLIEFLFECYLCFIIFKVFAKTDAEELPEP